MDFKKLGMMVGIFLLILSCQSQQSSQIRKIKQGKFEASITETGELQAVNSRVVVMPNLGWKYGRPKLARLIDEGSIVKEGDFLAEIDKSGIYKFLKQKENELEIAKANLNKLIVDHENQTRQLNSQLATTKASYNLETLQAEKLKFESSTKQKVSQLKLEKAEISLEKTNQNISSTKIIQNNELKIQKLKIFMLENEVENARIALTRATLVAPSSGLIEYKENRRTRQKIRIGDELWPGAAIVGIPDLSRMKVLAKVNELDINKVYIGQRVIVRLDAFPEVPFEGEITELAKLCQKKENDPLIKLFDIVILLKKSDPILKPGMTVSCEIFTSKLDNVLYIENDCIIRENSKYFLQIKNKSDGKKQEIKIGPRNNKFTVIYGDVEEGQKVVANRL